MALYSINHTSLGKSTQERPYTAAAHLRYITLSKTRTAILSARMPDSMRAARDWLVREEDTARANARVIDKIRLALPHELDPREQHGLVVSFADALTAGRAPWYAAFHTKGKAQGNHHCHLIVRDRDPETGKRVIGFSERGSTERLRSLWEVHVNRALAEKGLDVRVDRRSLAAQGVDREPGLHVGPKASKLAADQVPLTSRPRPARNQPSTRSKGRIVNYPVIDAGRTRAARQQEIIQLNAKRDRFKVLGQEITLWASQLRSVPVVGEPAPAPVLEPLISAGVAQLRAARVRQPASNERSAASQLVAARTRGERSAGPSGASLLRDARQRSGPAPDASSKPKNPDR